MKTLRQWLMASLVLAGCQQARNQTLETESNMATEVQESLIAARTEFPPVENEARGAVSSVKPRLRIVVTWGGGISSCASWNLIQLQGSEPLYHGTTKRFEYGDRSGRIDARTVYASSGTCGRKDRGVISMDAVSGATLTLTYDMYDKYQRRTEKGTVNLNQLVKNGGFLPTKLSGGNFINVYAETY